MHNIPPITKKSQKLFGSKIKAISHIKLNVPINIIKKIKHFKQQFSPNSFKKKNKYQIF